MAMFHLRKTHRKHAVALMALRDQTKNAEAFQNYRHNSAIMERRKSRSKTIRRLSSMRSRNKSSAMETVILPKPNFELEDVLVSQLQISDVLHNCVLGESKTSWSSDERISDSPHMKRKQSCLYHRCYHDTKLTPLWHAFATLDSRAHGQALLGRLMNLSTCLASILGEEHHTDIAVQQQFKHYSQVPFSKYKRYVADTTSHRHVDANQLSSICWLQCKPRYLNNPLVDNLDSVVPTELSDAIYWLFCIFNKLTEPGTYPPSMDYEETELLMRKLLACLGMPWTSTHDESVHNDEFDKDEEFEPAPPLRVTFQQLLTVIADMVGVEIARSHSFYRAVQRLCLIEYQEIIKSGWLLVRKAGSDIWKKRWAVLQGSKLTFYVTVLCQYVKEEITLHSNMHIESLPGSSSHKHRFRVVEKEGFNITCEHEFSTSDSHSSHAWISLINVSIKIYETGMTAKTSEICERRMERFTRRESIRDVYKKKQDVMQTYERLREAKKKRSSMEEQLIHRAHQREAQMTFLVKVDKIYERLESIQYQRRLHNKEERERRLIKLFTNYERSVKLGQIIEDTWIPSTGNPKALSDLSLEKSNLENELKNLHISPVVIATSSENPTITLQPPLRSTSLEHYDFSCSSSENMSTTSTELSVLTLPDVTSQWSHR